MNPKFMNIYYPKHNLGDIQAEISKKIKEGFCCVEVSERFYEKVENRLPLVWRFTSDVLASVGLDNMYAPKLFLKWEFRKGIKMLERSSVPTRAGPSLTPIDENGAWYAFPA